MVQFKTSHLFEALQLAEITSLNNYISSVEYTKTILVINFKIMTNYSDARYYIIMHETIHITQASNYLNNSAFLDL